MNNDNNNDNDNDNEDNNNNNNNSNGVQGSHNLRLLKPSRRDQLVEQIHQMKEAQKRNRDEEENELRDEEYKKFKQDNSSVVLGSTPTYISNRNTFHKQRRNLHQVEQKSMTKSIPCPYGERCRFGDECYYSHSHFVNISNNILGTNDTNNPKTAPCRYGYACNSRLTSCPFLHPTEKCFYGEDCKYRETCKFNHNPPCKWGIECKKPMCPFSHVENEIQTESSIRSLSDSLPNTP